MAPSVTHADLHPLPEAELPRAHRLQMAQVLEAQERGTVWRGTAPVRYLDVEGVTFVRADAGGRIPVATGRAALAGGVGALVAVLGAATEGALGTTLLLAGAVGLAVAVYFLTRIPIEKRALQDGPTPHGIYLFEDAMVVVSEPTQVIHRPEPCGAHLYPKGSIIDTSVVSERSDDAMRYVVSLRVRKTTGEVVERRLDDYACTENPHPLARLLEAWRGASAA